MSIRPVREDDFEAIKKIHQEYFQGEFSFPDFLRSYLCSFVVTDNDHKIIVAGGVRTIAESVIVTDKSFDAKTKRDALYQILHASAWICSQTGYDQLHAFIQDPKWLSHLKRVGFKECKGKAIVINV